MALGGAVGVNRVQSGKGEKGLRGVAMGFHYGEAVGSAFGRVT